MDCLQQLLENTEIPLIAALILGFLTAVSPCPLAMNIAAIGYIGKDIERRSRIFLNGLLYTLGRVVVYTALGVILLPIIREGASIYSIQKFIATYGEMAIGPVLLVVGLFMLFGDKLNLPKYGINIGGEKIGRRGAVGAFLLGALFALAFCPTSGLFYFGMLMPMAAASSMGFFLPVVFAIATAIPVIVVAWLLAYSVAGISDFYHRMNVVQKWTNRAIAFLFVVIGLYYIVTVWL